MRFIEEMNGENYNFKIFELQKIDCTYIDIHYIDLWCYLGITFENKTWDLSFVFKGDCDNNSSRFFTFKLIIDNLSNNHYSW